VRTRLKRLAALAVVIALAAGCAAGEAFRKGNAAAKAGDLDQAVAFYRTAAKAEPDNPNYKIALERALMAASRAHFEKAKGFEEQGQPMRDGGEAAARGGFVTELEALLREIEELAHLHGVDVVVPPTPGTPARHREFLRGYSNVLHNLAIALREAGRPEESLAVTSRTCRASPGTPPAMSRTAS